MKPNPLLSSKEQFRTRFDEIDAEYNALKAEHINNPEKLVALEKEWKDTWRDCVSQWERFKSTGMLNEAHKLDIDLPSIEDKDAWVGLDGSFGLPFLSTKGRLTMRRAIDEEKTRRREVASWWWKTVIIPSLTALTGLVGALTGLAAVLRHK